MAGQTLSFKKIYKFSNCLRSNQLTLHFPLRNSNPDILTIMNKPKMNAKTNSKMIGRDSSFLLTDWAIVHSFGLGTSQPQAHTCVHAQVHTHPKTHKVNRGRVLVIQSTHCFSQSVCMERERDQEWESRGPPNWSDGDYFGIPWLVCGSSHIVLYRQTLPPRLIKMDSCPSYWWESYLLGETVLPCPVGKINLRITEAILHLIFPAHIQFIADLIYKCESPSL